MFTHDSQTKHIFEPTSPAACVSGPFAPPSALTSPPTNPEHLQFCDESQAREDEDVT